MTSARGLLALKASTDTAPVIQFVRFADKLRVAPCFLMPPLRLLRGPFGVLAMGLSTPHLLLGPPRCSPCRVRLPLLPPALCSSNVPKDPALPLLLFSRLVRSLALQTLRERLLLEALALQALGGDPISVCAVRIEPISELLQPLLLRPFRRQPLVLLMLEVREELVPSLAELPLVVRGLLAVVERRGVLWRIVGRGASDWIQLTTLVRATSDPHPV